MKELQYIQYNGLNNSDEMLAIADGAAVGVHASEHERFMTVGDLILRPGDWLVNDDKRLLVIPDELFKRPPEKAS